MLQRATSERRQTIESRPPIERPEPLGNLTTGRRTLELEPMRSSSSEIPTSEPQKTDNSFSDVNFEDLDK